MRDHEEEDALCPGRDRTPHDQVPEPEPEEDLPGEFVESVPSVGLGSFIHEDEFQREHVEVEAAEAEEWVVEVFLVWDHELSECVVGHYTVVVG